MVRNTLYNNEYIVERLQNGDRKIFTEVYNTYSEAVYRNICRLVDNQTEAEDILQEVFVLFWNSKEKLLPAQKIDGWLFYTSYYKSMEFLKKSIKNKLLNSNDNLEQIELEDDEINMEDESFYIHKVELLRAGIEQLSEKRKKAFILCRMRGMSYDAAAEIMGITPITVKDYVKMATKILRKYAMLHDPTLSLFSLYLLSKFLK